MKKSIYLFAFVALLSACGGEEKHKETSGNKIAYNPELFVSDKDPVCNMSIKDGASDTSMVNGRAYGFCSPHCKESFDKDQAKYVK